MSVPSTHAPADVEKQLLALSNGPVKNGVFKIGREEATKATLVIGWMLLSSVVVIYNKWLFSTGGFPYPLALTAMHMTCCFVVFGAIRKLAPQNVRLAVMPDADVETPWPVYFKNFGSISLFYASTLGCGNLAYLFSSVAFLQMMKPMNCIFASFACFALGVEVPTASHIIIVCVIAFGVATATDHAATFSMAGCLLQIVSSVSEGCRLGLVQCATTKGLKLDPVTTVYHFSFPSAVLLSCACFALEWPLNLSKLLSPWVLVLNCALALVLNVVVATVIMKTSAVVFTLSGIVKDIGIIVVSSIAFSTQLTPSMMVGYFISMVGLLMFKAYKDNLKVFQEQGFIDGMRFVARLATGKASSLA